MVPLKRNIDAFSSLYDTYAPALYGVILKLTPDVELANSILEKSFLSFSTKLSDYDASKGSLFSLMLGITVQECKNEMHHSKNSLFHLLIRKEH
jgi:RNA polymerase sigma-70 factor (ECF subfamily)